MYGRHKTFGSPCKEPRAFNACLCSLKPEAARKSTLLVSYNHLLLQSPSNIQNHAMWTASLIFTCDPMAQFRRHYYDLPVRPKNQSVVTSYWSFARPRGGNGKTTPMTIESYSAVTNTKSAAYLSTDPGLLKRTHSCTQAKDGGTAAYLGILSG